MLLLVLAVYAAAASWLAFRLPAFSGPNEGLHYEYVAILRRTGRLPDPAASERADERHQPPVYYAAAALLSLPFPAPDPAAEEALERNPRFLTTHRGNLNPYTRAGPAEAPALYAARLASLAFGLLGLLAIYAATRLTAPGAAPLVTALAAFNPAYLYFSAVANNDLPATAMAACAIAVATWLVVRNTGARWFAVWGAVFAGAVLTKANTVFLIAWLAAACLARWRVTGRVMDAARCGAAGLAGFAPLWAAWAVVNHARGADVSGVSRSVPLDLFARLGAGDLPRLAPELGRLWRSFWLDWSLGERGFAPDWFYLASAAVLVIALAGWLRRTPGARQPVWLPVTHAAWSAGLVCAFVAVKALMLKEAGFVTPEGRWLLPVVPSLAWLAGLGWARWWPAGSRSAAIAATAATGAAAATAVALMAVLVPALYPAAQRATGDQVPQAATPAGLLYAGQIELAATQAGALRIGEGAEIMLYWRARQAPQTDYVVSAQVLVPEAGQWRKLDEQSTYPGYGTAPTRDWRPGEVYQDAISFYPQGEINGPTRAVLGVWLLQDGGATPVERDGQPVEIPVARELVVRPAQALAPAASDALAAPVDFGALELIGLSHAREDAGLVVTLWWRARADAPPDYIVFAHALNASGQLIAQHDSSPDGGRCPTRLWQAGDVIRDTHVIALPAGSPAPQALQVGVYDAHSLERLPASHSGQALADRVFRLALH